MIPLEFGHIEKHLQAEQRRVARGQRMTSEFALPKRTLGRDESVSLL